ncbi:MULTISPECIES: dTDP-glucose 4,6-dehydratase [Actinosynnema]|uniref:dTDP-glucose 4,6-dehydratase n=1 Tax=Actinosynnema TaxID=40566 RepID=UPI0020A24C27|nr:dTDP-glucose 4,6-dehydratase [Actinosynnema pretiosum]MCP2097429.1 dTDP-glucose 4,6-dehydratase [Actinosynnema pretiosum]
MTAVLVTGGAGFIGSHLVKHLLQDERVSRVTVLDALTYAGSVENMGEAFLSPKLAFRHGNILDADLVGELVGEHEAIVHLAAESHVDRSFLQAGNFVTTNVLGTQTLLEAARRRQVAKFVHVSTDEVYGPLETGCAHEGSPLLPTVPYAASKAASDLIALSYHRTYGLPVCVTRSSNNYGPCQHPEKIIPLFATRLLSGQPVGLHGNGEHVRNWLHVADNCRGIALALHSGKPGEVYNIGGGTDLDNRTLADMLVRLCRADPALVRCVPDRQANDIRYAMDFTKITEELGYRPEQDLEAGLAETVAWYRANPSRWAPMLRTPGAPVPSVSLTVPAGLR